jgi:hypothetical protein
MEAAIVRVVLQMTVHADFRGITEDLGFMAGVAFRFRVLS